MSYKCHAGYTTCTLLSSCNSSFSFTWRIESISIVVAIRISISIKPMKLPRGTSYGGNNGNLTEKAVIKSPHRLKQVALNKSCESTVQSRVKSTPESRYCRDPYGRDNYNSLTSAKLSSKNGDGQLKSICVDKKANKINMLIKKIYASLELWEKYTHH